MHERLAGLVYDDEAQVGILARKLADAVHRVLSYVIDLERIIPAVLAWPQLHVGRAEPTHDFRSALGNVPLAEATAASGASGRAFRKPDLARVAQERSPPRGPRIFMHLSIYL